MQLFSVAFFVSAVAAIAVRQTDPPQCAISCLTTTNTEGCSITDNSCLCRNQQFIAAQAACIASACTNPSDLQQADTFAQQNCLAVGVTLSASSIPSATASATSSASEAAISPSESSSASSSSTSNGASTLVGSTPAVLLAGVAAFALAL